MAQVSANPATVPNPGQSEAASAGRPPKLKHPEVEAGRKLKEVPADASKFAALKAENFEDSALDKFYDYQAAQLETKARKLRASADRFRRMGCLPGKVGKQLSSMLDSISKAFDKLACDGVDIAACNLVRKNSGLNEWTIDDYNKIRVDAGLQPIGAKVAA